jgi:GMP synthase-like glutamine amidotransferase
VEILVLQHIACEPPAVYEDAMVARGARITRVELDDGEPLPAWQGFDAVVVMGGPMGSYDEGEFPWLVAEKALIGEAVRAGVPLFGACLGLQLLAAALGAAVYPGGTPEVGVLPVELTPAGVDDPIFGRLPSPFVGLQWHGDTFDLPVGAVSLLRSAAYENQGFRYGDSAYGVQFHLEIDEALAVEWAAIPAYEQAAAATLGPGGLDRMLADFRARAVEMERHARSLFGRWCALAEQTAGG